MKTPLQQLMEYMEQNQYFIGNDLLAKYKELIELEKAYAVNFAFKIRHEDFTLKEIEKDYEAIYNNGKKKIETK